MGRDIVDGKGYCVWVWVWVFCMVGVFCVGRGIVYETYCV